MSRSLGIALGLLAALITLGLLWQWLAMQDLLSIEQLKTWIATAPAWRDSPWTFLIVMAGYAGALLVMFPLSLMVALTGLAFGPTWGFVYATLGTLTSSVASYWVGRWLGRDVLMDYGGRHLHGMSRYLAKRGIRTMTVINLLPLAPFTLTNMMAGAFHLRFSDYMIGSTLGIVPGLAVVTLLGSQLGALVTATSREELGWSLAGLAAGIILLVALRRYVTQRGRRDQRRQGRPE
ncbi:TVP38/TMEM64 family protein [Vreelandella rituensis]|uniref:TVP38/TMEM64 family membrane protein n=1 Tax=Vreelandella rituensis TaxID=2282306 RepID=A0A368UAE3_9GAMM|nr:TVP38/TMEM64 family protein [Halomonas rituensis]RCV92143.1 TVP38/TMEM64 family protein [Halomonas rituensis]